VSQSAAIFADPIHPPARRSRSIASREEVEAFVGDQMSASDAGAFFGGYNFMTYICKQDL